VPNRLADETSPYLLQHASNPVDWYPWGDAAFARARDEDRPVLLSVGYAACHWCHVMAHESFEDAETAALMNSAFVNIKVDREERPDVDGIYMQAVQSMTGHGGWPMTVFLTPDGTPFYGGTYFPPQDRQGMPSFRRVLQSIIESYRTRRPAIDQTTAALRAWYDAQAEPAVASGPLGASLLARAYQGIAARLDRAVGGFEGAPKFPQAMVLDCLLRVWRRTGTVAALDAVRLAFTQMARGGIYDQVGGGFHRYTVDANWLVPHFEKMLYDNALLTRLGVHLWQATADAEVRRVTEATFEWLAREMTDADGGWYASLDADSEGHEGTFYVWDDGELDAVLGADGPLIRAVYGVVPGGTFEGRHILHRPDDEVAIAARLGVGPEALATAMTRTRVRLLAARSRRPRPMRDDKVIAAWNGLMLRAVADGARAFGRPEYRGMALANGAFLAREMVDGDGRVLRSWTRSTSTGMTRARGVGGFLEDHAAVALGFIGLYQLTFDRVWLDRAQAIAGAIERHFWDEAAQAFFDTADDAESLITRPREVTDNAVPSGTSLTVDLLLQLADLTDDAARRSRAEWVLTTLAEPMARHGAAFGNLLGAADRAIHGATQVALIGDLGDPAFDALDAAVGRAYVPDLALAAGRGDGVADHAAAHGAGVVLLNGRPAIDGRPTAYVCHGFVCDRPVTDADALASQLTARVVAA
jgi:uncharacterized protein YyaL (SSP411 family)